MKVKKVVKQKTENIDSKRVFIHVKDSKGRKDRYTMLSEIVLQTLREYMEQYKPQKWLFEVERSGRYLSTRTLKKILEHAV